MDLRYGSAWRSDGHRKYARIGNEPNRGNGRPDRIVEVRTIIDSRNPYRVGRAGVGEGHECHRNEQNAEGIRAIRLVADTLEPVQQRHSPSRGRMENPART